MLQPRPVDLTTDAALQLGAWVYNFRSAGLRRVSEIIEALLVRDSRGVPAGFNPEAVVLRAELHAKAKAASRKGGQSVSPRKLEACRRNAALATTARKAKAAARRVAQDIPPVL